MPTTIILSIIENYEEGFGGRAQIIGYSATKESEISKENKIGSVLIVRDKRRSLLKCVTNVNPLTI